MEQTFIKRIQGLELEFKRKHSPLGYTVSLTNIKQNGVTLDLKKDGKGIWDVNQSVDLPVWFNEISLDIHYAIEENEIRINKTTSVPAAIENKQFNSQNSFRLSCLY